MEENGAFTRGSFSFCNPPQATLRRETLLPSVETGFCYPSLVSVCVSGCLRLDCSCVYGRPGSISRPGGGGKQELVLTVQEVIGVCLYANLQVELIFI